MDIFKDISSDNPYLVFGCAATTIVLVLTYCNSLLLIFF